MTEVFKRLVGLKPAKGELLDGVTFSFWTYRTGSEDPGPRLPDGLLVELLMVGGGAIGNGTAYLLSRLPLYGRALVIDRQRYRKENWGTGICLGPDDVGRAPDMVGRVKAEFIAEVLGPKRNPTWRCADIADLATELTDPRRAPRIIVSGLDDIDPRHEVQRLWPDLVIDGAIDAGSSCQVSCHPWGEDTACLMSLFRQPPSERAELVASRATGLDPCVFGDDQAVITQAHIDAAPAAKKPWLAKHLGKPVCSVASEAVIAMLSSEKQAAGFAPSVPFVACFSACMISTELVRYLVDGRTLPEPRYQLNLLWGPQRGGDYPQARRPTCFCVQRADVINGVKARRRDGGRGRLTVACASQ